jgi:hypothetical protein
MKLATMLVLMLIVAATPGYPASRRECKASKCAPQISACKESCNTLTGRKRRSCRAKCKKTTTRACRQDAIRCGEDGTGPVPPGGTCNDYSATCTALPLTPVIFNGTPENTHQYELFVEAVSGPAYGPGSCCVVDTCAGVTGAADSSYIVVAYSEHWYGFSGEQDQVLQAVGMHCNVFAPEAVYGPNGGTYQIGLPWAAPQHKILAPSHAHDWEPPFTVSADRTSIAFGWQGTPPEGTILGPAIGGIIDDETWVPATWRVLGESVSVSRVCGEQEAVTASAQITLRKVDGAECTVTIHAQGTRVVR